MALSRETMQILEMLSEGKISVEESAKLLEAIQAVEQKLPPESKTVLVKITEQGKEITNLKIPVKFANLFWRFIPKELQAQIDIELILAQIEAGAVGLTNEIEQKDSDRSDRHQSRITLYLQQKGDRYD